MEQEKISVIIPVYNTGKYLTECVDSVLNQTYQNLEVILVDDGSKDNSLEICKKLQEKDDRVRVFHQDNSGPGAARNKGIEESIGDYIAFVDSDDSINCDMYKTLIDLMKKYDAELVCSSLTNDGKQLEIQVFNRDEALYNRLKTNKISDSSCDKLYKKTLFDNYRYPCDRSLSEDSALIYKLVAESRLTILTNQVFYNIRQTENSLSRRDYSTYFRFTIVTYEEMVDFFTVSREEKFVEIAQTHAVGAVFFNAGEYCKYKCKDKETKKFIKEHAKKQLKEYKHLTLKNRILLYLIAFCFELFGLLYRCR